MCSDGVPAEPGVLVDSKNGHVCHLLECTKNCNFSVTVFRMNSLCAWIAGFFDLATNLLTECVAFVTSAPDGDSGPNP